MVEPVYEKLIPVLNSRSTFLVPCIKCDEFLNLAAYMYSPVEAEIACAMPYDFATAREIAANIPGSHPEKIAEHLETMANKALIHSKKENGETLTSSCRSSQAQWSFNSGAMIRSIWRSWTSCWASTW